MVAGGSSPTGETGESAFADLSAKVAFAKAPSAVAAESFLLRQGFGGQVSDGGGYGEQEGEERASDSQSQGPIVSARNARRLTQGHVAGQADYAAIPHDSRF